MKLTTFIIVLLLFNQSLFGTHIVGGEIKYKYLGGKQYQISFIIYRDCASGTAEFDGDAPKGPNYSVPEFTFGVIPDGNVNTISQYSYPSNVIPFVKNQVVQIDPIIQNSCLTINNSCVEAYEYSTTISVPDLNKGYTLIYQRCCRNAGILNIQNYPGQPDKPGFTLMAYIPPTATYQNSSATFKSFPPIFICVNQAFYFDHSAKDPDNDSLAYSIMTPYQGLSPLSNQASTTSPSTLGLQRINWQPPYSESNVLGGSPPLSIDPVTGLLYCKPNTQGRFVVSVVCKEYRNGKIIDSIYRDFQFNVVSCDIPNAQMSFMKDKPYDPLKNVGTYYINCDNLTVNFSHQSTNYSSLKWNFGDPNSGANNTSTAETPSHTFSSPGDYTITLYAYKYNSSGQLCVDSLKRFVKVYPTFLASFNPTNACQGVPITFIDNTRSDVGTVNSWAWTFGDGGSAGTQNTTHTFNNAGTYSVKLVTTNNKECKDDTSINITIFPLPSIKYAINTPCLDGYLVYENKTTISSPSSISSFKWVQIDGTVSTNIKDSIYLSKSGNYSMKLVAISNNSCIDSAIIPVNVSAKPIITASNDQTICYNDSAQVSASGGVRYEWSPASLVSNPNIANPFVKPIYNIPQTYFVKGYTSFGCSNIDSVTISFFPKPTLNAGKDTNVCLNAQSSSFKNSYTMNVTGNCIKFLWSPALYLDNPTIQNPTSTPTQSTTYFVTGTDINNCRVVDTISVLALDSSIDIVPMKDTSICRFDTLTIYNQNQGQGTLYNWTPAIYISNPNVQNPRVFPHDTTKYTLTITNYCYSKADDVQINIVPTPEPLLNKLDSICIGNKYTFNPKSSSSFKYEWRYNVFLDKLDIQKPTAFPTISSNYVVTVTNSYGCKGYDSTYLIVNYLPDITIVGLKDYICQGDTIEIEASTGYRNTFLWTPNSNIDNPLKGKVKLFPRDTTQYAVEVTSPQNCKNNKRVQINVQKPIKITIDTPARICIGTYKYLNAQGGLYYLWSPSSTLNDSSAQYPQAYPKTNTIYKVKISNDCFKDSSFFPVYVDTLPKVKASNDTTIYRGTSAILNAITAAKKIQWTPFETILNPFNNEITVNPLDTQLYTITVRDDNGCVGKDSVWVFIDPKTVLLVPTGFSPNGDGLNDEFRIAKYLNIRTLVEFSVYNRWGELVFSTSDLKKGWDGKFKNEDAEIGVYVWSVKAKTYENKDVIQTGNVTLLR
jgi:gliding motility-associated-like protein